MVSKAKRLSIKAYTDHFGDLPSGWLVYHLNGDVGDVCPDNMFGLPKKLYAEVTKDDQHYTRQVLSNRLRAYLEFEHLKEEARKRIEADPSSNPYGLNLEMFDVAKVLSRPHVAKADEFLSRLLNDG
jgi:hypothetical protein